MPNPPSNPNNKRPLPVPPGKPGANNPNAMKPGARPLPTPPKKPMGHKETETEE